MASANFNTQILSPNSIVGEYFYILDDVITKDFEGPYNYSYNSNEVPAGVNITEDKLGQKILVIPPLVNFELSIIVSNSDKTIIAAATTTVTIEEREPNGIANFNTNILSSKGNDFREYILDDVITKDFLPQRFGYGYQIYSDFTPEGVEIIYNLDDSAILRIPPMVEFELSILVDDGTKERLTFAIATTMVNIDPKPSFNEIKDKFYNGSNYGQLNDNTKKNWSSIVSERVSGSDLIDGPVRPR